MCNSNNQKRQSHNNNPYNLCNNYHPISLLCSKIIEKLINVRLTMSLNAKHIFYEKQFGFRHSHSTTYALFEITEKIKQVCNSGQLACESIYLEVSGEWCEFFWQAQLVPFFPRKNILDKTCFRKQERKL